MKKHNIERLTDPHTGDVCCRTRHASGLEIRVMEMPGFSTAYAQFGTRFGSVHTRFQIGETTVQVPEGTAHYLEHKLFEKEDGDISAAFSRLGAADNAYTDFDRTVYHFQTQRNFPEALAVLLEFVQKPYFTPESIEKERGIIAQEILESLDDPATQAFMQMLQGMYHRHPVSRHVLGSAESIAAITPEILYQCHAAFYRPENMVLCCAGNVTLQQVLETADRILLPAPASQARGVLLLPDEPQTVRRKTMQRKMEVGKTQFCIGFKSPPASPEQQMRESLLVLLTADLLIGEIAPLHRELLASGLINDTFSTDCCFGDSWFTFFAEGESDDPQAVLNALLCEITRMQTEGIDSAHFAALKRAAYGEAVLGMNDPGTACDILLESYFAGSGSPFDRTEILASIRQEDVQECLRTRFCADQICLSVIAPEYSF